MRPQCLMAKLARLSVKVGQAGRRCRALANASEASQQVGKAVLETLLASAVLEGSAREPGERGQ